MRVHVLTFGSRGDVQPYVALCARLKKEGHTPILVAGAEFAPMAEARGIAFRPIHANAEQLLRSESGQAWLRSGANPVAMVRRAIDAARDMMEQADQDVRSALADAEVIVSAWTTQVSFYRARHMKIPWIGVWLQPLWPTREHSAMMAPVRNLGGPLNYVSHVLQDTLVWHMQRTLSNRFAREQLGHSLPLLGMRPDVVKSQSTMAFAISPSLIPRPKDWPEQVTTSGYLYLHDHQDWEPSPELLDWLGAGPPPVYIGFGSMADKDAQNAAHMVVEGVRRARVRGLLLTGWGGLETDIKSEQFFQIQSAPHEWLFPRMSAVVHHGGAGTTAAGLWSGVPSILVPFFGDQPFWGRVVKQAGVGPTPVSRWRMTPELLKESIVATQAPEMRTSAARLGEKIRAEDGAGEAVRLIERAVARVSPRLLQA